MDGTLILWSGDDPGKAKAGEIPVMNLQVIKMIISFKEKGYTIVGWSYGGKEYVDKWLHAFALEPLFDYTVGKPSVYIDDGIKSVLNRKVIVP
jgi:hypothetical protein